MVNVLKKEKSYELWLWYLGQREATESGVVYMIEAGNTMSIYI